jgi:exosome complex component RRP45
LGGLPLAAEEVVEVVNIAVGQAKEMEKLVEGALREDWEGRKGGVEVR